MPAPKEQLPQKLSGKRTVWAFIYTILESGRGARQRRWRVRGLDALPASRLWTPAAPDFSAQLSLTALTQFPRSGVGFLAVLQRKAADRFEVTEIREREGEARQPVLAVKWGLDGEHLPPLHFPAATSLHLARPNRGFRPRQRGWSDPLHPFSHPNHAT